MIVSKFGGTSVGSAENIKKVIQIVKEKNEKAAIVVSALGGVTNLLIEAADLALDNKDEYEKILGKTTLVEFANKTRSVSKSLI